MTYLIEYGDDKLAAGNEMHIATGRADAVKWADSEGDMLCAVWRVDGCMLIDLTDEIAEELAEKFEWEFDSEGDPLNAPPRFIAAHVSDPRDVWETMERYERPYLQSEFV